MWETCLAPGWPQLRSGLPFGKGMGRDLPHYVEDTVGVWMGSAWHTGGAPTEDQPSLLPCEGAGAQPLGVLVPTFAELEQLERPTHCGGDGTHGRESQPVSESHSVMSDSL